VMAEGSPGRVKVVSWARVGAARVMAGREATVAVEAKVAAGSDCLELPASHPEAMAGTDRCTAVTAARKAADRLGVRVTLPVALVAKKGDGGGEG